LDNRLAKQIVFIYRGQRILLRQDPDGSKRVPAKDEVVSIDGTNYKAVTDPQWSDGARGEWQVYTVYLDLA
jgi:hypothetical protein